MKNGCLFIVVLFVFIMIIGSLSGSGNKNNVCNKNTKIEAALRVYAKNWFKNPKSYDHDMTISVEKIKTNELWSKHIENDSMYRAIFYAYAQNGFGGTARNKYIALLVDSDNCDVNIVNLGKYDY